MSLQVDRSPAGGQRCAQGGMLAMSGYRGSSLSVGSRAIVAGLILLIAGIISYNVLLNDYDLTYELTDQGVHVKHRAGFLVKAIDFTLRYRDISVVQTLAPFPKHKKINGIDGVVRIGDFTVDGVGAMKLYAQTTKRPLVVLATADGVYGLTPQDTAVFTDRVEAGRQGSVVW